MDTSYHRIGKAMASPEDGDLVETPNAKLPVPDNVQQAIRTLICWAGDDPEREGLLDTPARVARASAGVAPRSVGTARAGNRTTLARGSRSGDEASHLVVGAI